MVCTGGKSQVWLWSVERVWYEEEEVDKCWRRMGRRPDEEDL